MGVSNQNAILLPNKFMLVIFLASFFSSFPPLFADIETIPTPLNPSPSPPPPPPPPPLLPPLAQSNITYKPEETPFRPSIAVVVGVLTTMFSITFLLLLYAKHCKNGNDHNNSIGGYNISDPSSRRKNSGINRAVIESLPIFRFSSLRGQKDGLECAVCLTRFEPTEVLRLLPKCKHAFHVECVDTWLDAHSTCPLCRYRVDPEDILLIDSAPESTTIAQDPGFSDLESGKVGGEGGTGSEATTTPGFRRISGRHSSAGERRSGWFNQKSGGSGGGGPTTSYRMSLDGSSWRKKSLTSSTEPVTVGCFDRRKDGLLLTNNSLDHRTRLEHRIIVSPRGGFHQRWSDVQPSDLLFLRSEMIISDNRRLSLSASGSLPSVNELNEQRSVMGKSVISTRSVSEITGLNRFDDRRGGCNSSNHNNVNNNANRERQVAAGLVSRWLAWISSPSQPAVRSGGTTTATVVLA